MDLLSRAVVRRKRLTTVRRLVSSAPTDLKPPPKLSAITLNVAIYIEETRFNASPVTMENADDTRVERWS